MMKMTTELQAIYTNQKVFTEKHRLNIRQTITKFYIAIIRKFAN
ncbi:hypothetical protein CoNPh11_CDS0015 [Staphylococcus phage S-CoN_Ph11]|nr:hypothetical protein CoNPh11_CDS0015 [Staphylococcus phage S-CoN_Ph11]